MHAIFHLLMLSLAANLDNLGVGVAYGVRRIKVPVVSNVIIATIAFVFGLISILCGSYISRFLAESTANMIGALLLIGVGIWVMLPGQNQPIPQSNPTPPSHSVIEILHQPELADSDHSAVISWQESILLGVALSINVLTNGITAGLWKMEIWLTSFCMAIFSFLTIAGGTWLGARYGSHWLGNKASYAAGIVLIILGIHQL